MMSARTLNETVIAAQNGDREAFDELVLQFESRVFGIVMQRLRNTAEADEVVQEVFLLTTQTYQLIIFLQL